MERTLGRHPSHGVPARFSCRSCLLIHIGNKDMVTARRSLNFTQPHQIATNKHRQSPVSGCWYSSPCSWISCVAVTPIESYINKAFVHVHDVPLPPFNSFTSVKWHLRTSWGGISRLGLIPLATLSSGKDALSFVCLTPINSFCN